MMQATACTAVFVRAIEKHVLRAQYYWQENNFLLNYGLTTFHLTAVHCCSTEAPRHLYSFHACLTRAWHWNEVERASEKSPVWCGRKDVLRLNKCNSCQENKKTEAAIVSGVANPSSAPALTVLKIFNAHKLEKWIACVNANFDSTTLNLYIKQTNSTRRHWFCL